LREDRDRYVLDAALPPLAIPTTLHASLLARLDRLASVRHVAQIGAAIGREFPYELLHAVSRLPEDKLQTALGRLVASELVFQRGAPPDAVYSFKHALVQDAAHGSLLRSARQQLHAQIAEVLEANSPETMENQPELLAQHYTEAELVEKSVACWGKAGHRSAARSAMAEAAAQFHKGLDQLALLTCHFGGAQRTPESPLRAGRADRRHGDRSCAGPCVHGVRDIGGKSSLHRSRIFYPRGARACCGAGQAISTGLGEGRERASAGPPECCRPARWRRSARWFSPAASGIAEREASDRVASSLSLRSFFAVRWASGGKRRNSSTSAPVAASSSPSATHSVATPHS
jgi:hypothetical protein